MSSAVVKIGPQKFRVDFAKLRRKLQPILRRISPKRERVEVDPYLIAQAVRAIMQQCTTKSPDGQLLVWNEFKIFVSSKDHNGLRPLVDGLEAGLDTLIRQALTELQAATIGDPMVRVKLDEYKDVAQGMGEVEVQFVKSKALAPPAPGDFTVRLGGGPHHRSRPPRDEGTRPASKSASPAGPGALLLTWDSQKASIEVGTKVVVGRPHPDPPVSFVPLVGASKRISSIHLAIENSPNGVVITRPSSANPVDVGGRPVQRGGKRSVDTLPVEIALSNGEMVLKLTHSGS